MTEREPRDLAGALFDALSELGRSSEVTVHGWSMRPLIDYGDTVRIRHGGPEPRAGALVAFRRGDRIVVHRMLRRLRAGSETVYLCRGDATVRRDPIVRRKSLLGVIEAVRKEGSPAWIDLGRPRWRLVGAAMLLKDMLQSRTPLPRVGGGSVIDRVVAFLLPRQ